MNDRLEAVLAIFRPGGPASQAELARRAQVAAQTLCNDSSLWRPATKTVVLMAGAEILEIDFARLAAWVSGEDDNQLGSQIAWLRTARKCTGCGGVFEVGLIHPRVGRCGPCRSPLTLEWLSEIDRLIGQAPRWLHEAWFLARADLSVITFAGLAQHSGRSIEEVERAWTAADLPRRKAGGYTRLRPASPRRRRRRQRPAPQPKRSDLPVLRPELPPRRGPRTHAAAEGTRG